MGYRDDMIQRLKQAGIWDQLTGEQRQRFEGLTDEQARQILVMDDQWEMGEERAIEIFGLLSLVRVIRLFKGALVETQGERIGKLSKAGQLLAEFFLELRQRGLSADEIDAGLEGLSQMAIAALITAHTPPASE